MLVAVTGDVTLAAADAVCVTETDGVDVTAAVAVLVALLVTSALGVPLVVRVASDVCVAVRDGVPEGDVVLVMSDVAEAVTDAVKLGVGVSDAVVEPAHEGASSQVVALNSQQCTG